MRTLWSNTEPYRKKRTPEKGRHWKKMQNTTGNISTIAKIIVMIIAPYLATYGVTSSQLESIIIAILTLIIAVIDAKYPNNIFNNNDTSTLEVENEDTNE